MNFRAVIAQKQLLRFNVIDARVAINNAIV